MRTCDTIAAIATALSESGIGIIRVSGEDSIKIVNSIFSSDKLLTAASHTIHHGYIINNINNKESEIIDEVLVMLMKAPHTYTGEDTVEIDCHGGILVVQKVLEKVIEAGANLAEPGEFTKRAFLNGKIDLSQAEAVIDIIEAKNSYALKSGIQQLSGQLTNCINEIRKEILNEIAYIEAALDDPEHYDFDGYSKKLTKIVKRNIYNLNKLIDNAGAGIAIKEGISTVIIGKPNAGKSSLLNLLAKKERAIVTDVAGTTRDTLTEHIKMSGISLNITDTAGIRESQDIVEKIGIDKAKDAAVNADLILCVIDSSSKLDNNDIEILESLKNKEAIVLLNKSDLIQIIGVEDVKKYTDKPIINFSAKENIGLTEVENLIKNMFYNGEIDFNDQIYVTNVRQKEALISSKDSLEMVLSSIEENLPEDFFSIDLLNAYESLGIITGETVEDDVIDKIFEKFCMGK